MSKNNTLSIDVAIIGAGPAGLMAAEMLAAKGIKVDIFDAMPTAGRKFLMAGKSGLNISHNENLTSFLTKFGSKQQKLAPALTAFNATHIIDFMKTLDIETFIGSSGRIFPKVMKTAPLLRNWLQSLNKRGARLHTRHKWTGWTKDGALEFSVGAEVVKYEAKATLLALGGGSCPKLGSDAAWVNVLTEKSIKVNPLKPSNCGFDVSWSEHFISKNEGQAVTNILLSFNESTIKGSFVITKEGVEGGIIYMLSANLRDAIESGGATIVKVDLTPDISQAELATALSRDRGSKSMSNHIRRTTGLTGVKAQLLRECLPQEIFSDPAALATAIKSLPLTLERPRPLAEAISSAGGVCFDMLDDSLMLKSLENTYCSGEMLDWEAPTGGYLITACMATGAWAGNAIAKRSFKRLDVT
jgi:uncharacterized flavoprotein (TIGR03862 family)